MVRIKMILVKLYYYTKTTNWIEARPVIEYYTGKGAYIINRDLNNFLRFQTRRLVEYGEYDGWALVPDENIEGLISIVDDEYKDGYPITKVNLILRELLK